MIRLAPSPQPTLKVGDSGDVITIEVLSGLRPNVEAATATFGLYDPATGAVLIQGAQAQITKVTYPDATVQTVPPDNRIRPQVLEAAS